MTFETRDTALDDVVPILDLNNDGAPREPNRSVLIRTGAALGRPAAKRASYMSTASWWCGIFSGEALDDAYTRMPLGRPSGLGT